MLDCQLSPGCSSLADLDAPDCGWLDDFLRPQELQDDPVLLAGFGVSSEVSSASQRPVALPALAQPCTEYDKNTESAVANWDTSLWTQHPECEAADGTSPRLRPSASHAVQTPTQQSELPAGAAMTLQPQQQGGTEEARARRIQTLIMLRQLQLQVDGGSPRLAVPLPPLPLSDHHHHQQQQQQHQQQHQQPAGCSPVLLRSQSMAFSSTAVLAPLRLSLVRASGGCNLRPPSLPTSPLRQPLPGAASLEPPACGGCHGSQQEGGLSQEPRAKRARVSQEDRQLPIPSVFSLLQENMQLREEVKLLRGVLKIWLGREKVPDC